MSPWLSDVCLYGPRGTTITWVSLWSPRQRRMRDHATHGVRANEDQAGEKDQNHGSANMSTRYGATGEEHRDILERLADLIPQATLARWSGVGHMFWWERPDETAEVVRKNALAR